MNVARRTAASYPRRRSFLFVMLSLAAVVAVVFLISLNTGLTRLNPLEVVRTFAGYGTKQSSIVLFDIRLPRIVIALLVGAGLAVAGAIMQGVSQNGLADPGILGINAGAGLAVVLYIALLYGKIQYAPVMLLPVLAFTGAAAAAALVFALAWQRGRIAPMRLALVGVAVAAGLSALMLFFTYRMNAYNYDFVKIWMSGSVWGTNWTYVQSALLWVAVLLPCAFVRSPRLNMLELGDELAGGIGLSVQKERLYWMTIAVGLAGSCVAVAGSIGFVGLIGPHLARKITGVDYRRVLPVSALLGASLVLAADTIGRTIVHPIEIPAGIVVAAIGGPYFLYLLMRGK